jgi:hypothetical protein
MKLKDMRRGIRYVVTRGQSRGTLRAGDHVWINEKYCGLDCKEAGGWIDKEDFERMQRDGRVKTEVELDVGYYRKRIAAMAEETVRCQNILDGHLGREDM